MKVTRVINARLIDPAQAIDTLTEVWIGGGVVLGIGSRPANVDARAADLSVVDARGYAMLPGLSDLGVCSDDGRWTEGSAAERAALAGGVTRMVITGVTSLPERSETRPAAPIRIASGLPSQGEPEQQAAVSPDYRYVLAWPHKPVIDAMQARAEAPRIAGLGFGLSCLRDTAALHGALQFAADHDLTVWLTPTDALLEAGGVMAQGAYSLRLGLPGIARDTQSVALRALFDLMRQTGARVHVGPLVTSEAVEAVRAAKREGLKVSCDVNVHHLHLADVDIGYFDTRYRFDPPLYGPADRDALSAGVRDGTIDAIVSGHASIGPAAKARFFEYVLPGAPALGLLLSLVLSWAARERVPVLQALALLTTGPDRILKGLDGPQGLSVGRAADFVLVDLDAWWQARDMPELIHPELSPFSQAFLVGSVKATYIQGYRQWHVQ